MDTFPKFTRALATGLAALVLALPAGATEVESSIVDLLSGRDEFESFKLSPTGEYLAATVPLEDKTVLVVMRRDPFELTGTVNLRGNNHVIDFWWASDSRVLLTIGEKFGRLEQPRPTGELMATDADGGNQRALVGYRAGPGGSGTGSRIPGVRAEFVAANVVDPLPDDDRHALVSIWNFGSTEEQMARVERLNIHTGRRTPVALAPVARASFVTDHDGEVRFAVGSRADNRAKTFYRESRGAEWRLVNDQAVSGRAVVPLGFSADNQWAYVLRDEDQGPGAIHRLDLETLELEAVLRGEFADPSPVRDPITGALLGAVFMEGVPRVVYLDDGAREAQIDRALQANFSGSLVRTVSSTRGGALRLLEVSSDHSPVDYFLFNAETMAADFLVGRRAGVDPEQMARVEPVQLQARDGLTLHGYLTVPLGLEARNLPLVVNPHGGPFNVYDRWQFDEESQLLAGAGYAVLRINFRGSGNYGSAFIAAGYRQWGQAMQDDLTDATRWAIEQGIADPERICIYGSSYGAYAALMGVAREPELYRCAVGNVGVYDLALLHRSGDIPRQESGRRFLEEVLGSEGLEANSPTRLANRISVPVMLVAGGQDERAPVEHTERMAAALQKADVPVTKHVYPNEGHGFHLDVNRRDYARRLLSFLGNHLDAAPDPAP